MYVLDLNVASCGLNSANLILFLNRRARPEERKINGTIEPSTTQDTFVASLDEDNSRLRESIDALRSDDNEAKLRALDYLATNFILIDQDFAQEVLDALIPLCQSDNARVKKLAVQVMSRVRLNSEEAVNALIPLLRDEDNDIRALAIEALGSAGEGSYEAVNSLIPFCQDRNVVIRRRVTQVLGRIGKNSPRAVNSLIRLLRNDSDLEVRRSAANGLGDIGYRSQEALSALIEASRDNNVSIRLNAIRGLGNIQSNSREAINTLLNALRDSDPRIRGQAASAFASLQNDSKEVVNALLLALNDNDLNVRLLSARALGSAGQGLREVTSFYSSILRENNPQLQYLGLLSLQLFGQSSREATDALVQFLGTEYGRRNLAGVFRAISMVGVPSDEAVNVLLTHLRNTNLEPEDRLSLIGALGKVGVGSRSATEALIPLLRSREPEEQQRAAIALANIGTSSGDLVNILIEALRSTDDTVRNDARDALMRVGQPSVQPLIQQFGNGISSLTIFGIINQIGEGAIDDLLGALRSEDLVKRGNAAQCLGVIGSRLQRGERLDCIVTELSRLASSDNRREVRIAAIQALGRIGPQARSVVPTLNKIVETTNDRLEEVRRAARDALEEINRD